METTPNLQVYDLGHLGLVGSCQELCLRVLLDLDPRDVKKEGVLCSKIVSTPVV